MLPAWAAERASARGRRYAEEIAAAGVRVVGDLSVLAAPVSGADQPAPPPDTVDVDVAVELAAGLLSAGTGRGPFFSATSGRRVGTVDEFAVGDLAGSVLRRAGRRLAKRAARKGRSPR